MNSHSDEIKIRATVQSVSFYFSYSFYSSGPTAFFRGLTNPWRNFYTSSLPEQTHPMKLV